MSKIYLHRLSWLGQSQQSIPNTTKVSFDEMSNIYSTFKTIFKKRRKEKYVYTFVLSQSQQSIINTSSPFALNLNMSNLAQ